jgi:putative heme-binding domain-containing protein
MIALDAAGTGIVLEDPAFSLLRKILVSEQALELRGLAAMRLASATLTEVQAQQLVDIVPDVGPMELPKILPAFEAFPSQETGQRLLTALQESKGMAGLRADLLQTLLGKYPEAVQESGKSLLKMLNAGLEEQIAVLEQTLASLPEGDVRRGHEVFMSRRAACNTCHKLGYGGGTLGPDLTSIGRVRNRRDLLEAILFPGASLVRGYEPVSVELEDGRVISGIVRGENADEVTVAVDAQKTVKLARSSILQILPSSVSPMPNGIATLLSPQELADLLAFLQTDQR